MRAKCRRSPGAAGFSSSTPHQHLVQRHQVLLLGRLHDDGGLLRLEQRALRIQHVQEAGHAIAKAQLGQVGARLFGGGLGLLCAQLVAIGGAAGQRIGHLAEGHLDRAFVLRHRDVAVGLAQLQVGLVGAGVEDRQGDSRRKLPGAVVEQPTQVAAGQADAAGERDAREKGGLGRADVGVGGLQLALRPGARRGGAPAATTAARPADRPSGPGRPAPSAAAGPAAAAGRPAAPARSGSASAGAAARPPRRARLRPA